MNSETTEAYLLQYSVRCTEKFKAAGYPDATCEWNDETALVSSGEKLNSLIEEWGNAYWEYKITPQQQYLNKQAIADGPIQAEGYVH